MSFFVSMSILKIILQQNKSFSKIRLDFFTQYYKVKFFIYEILKYSKLFIYEINKYCKQTFNQVILNQRYSQIDYIENNRG